MKKLLATVIFSSVFILTFSQKSPVKFGDIPMEDMKMTVYDKDSSAVAVILADYGVSQINYSETDGGFILNFERTTRIKILTKDGYEYGNFQIPIYHNQTDKEKLSGLKVVTYNLEKGKIAESKMKSDQVFEEKYDQNLDILKFSAPSVREGTIVEVTYKIKSDFLYYFRDWEFQSKIPTVWSEYRAYIPEYFHYDKFMQGYILIPINETKDNPKSITLITKERTEGRVTQTNFYTDKINYLEKYHRWAAKDVPSFREEPFMTTYDDFISKINFELSFYKFPNQPIKQIVGTWVDLNKSFLESDNFFGPVKGSGYLKKTVEELTTGLETTQQKIESIYNYVKQNIEWDGSYRKYLDKNFKDALENKKGSSAEINLLLVSMLRKADFTADPVLISTRNHGFIREHMAISSQFNYVICRVLIDGKNILLDATDKLLPINLLPERCLNGRGFVVSENSSGWISLGSPKSRKVASTDLAISPEGLLKGKMLITSDGYEGYRVRKVYFKKGEEDYLKDFAQTTSWVIEKNEFENIKKLNEPVKEIYYLTFDHGSGSEVIYIDPMVHLKTHENPFKSDKREYPVDFGSISEKTLIVRLTFPENYSADELPVSKVINLPNNAGRFLYNVQLMGNVVNVTSTIAINQPLFAQTEYPILREFYNIIVAKQNEQIVLKKSK